MNPCDRCKRPMDLKCCHNCKKDAAECDVWHDCGKDCPKWEAQIQTNADRIRAMSDEELAHELAMVASWDRTQYQKAKRIGMEKVMLDWLQQPVTEVNHENG